MFQVRQAEAHVRRHAGQELLSENGWVDMSSIELNALEIGSVQVSEEGRKIRIGVDSRAAVKVFSETMAEDYSMLKIPDKAKNYRRARKVQVKLKDGSFRCVNLRVADTHRAPMAVSEMNDMGHDVHFPRSDRGIKACA